MNCQFLLLSIFMQPFINLSIKHELSCALYLKTTASSCLPEAEEQAASHNRKTQRNPRPFP